MGGALGRAGTNREGSFCSEMIGFGPTARAGVLIRSLILKITPLSVESIYHLRPQVYPLCQSGAFLPASVKEMMRGKQYPVVQIKPPELCIHGCPYPMSGLFQPRFTWILSHDDDGFQYASPVVSHPQAAQK